MVLETNPSLTPSRVILGLVDGKSLSACAVESKLESKRLAMKKSSALAFVRGGWKSAVLGGLKL